MEEEDILSVAVPDPAPDQKKQGGAENSGASPCAEPSATGPSKAAGRADLSAPSGRGAAGIRVLKVRGGPCGDTQHPAGDTHGCHLIFAAISDVVGHLRLCTQLKLWHKRRALRMVKLLVTGYRLPVPGFITNIRVTRLRPDAPIRITAR